MFERIFKRYNNKKPLAFALWLFLEVLFVSIVVSLILNYINQEPIRDIYLLPTLALIIIGILIAPFLETFLAQTIPIFLIKKFSGNLDLQVLVSTLFFSLLHVGDGLNTIIVVGFIGGIYFGYTYAFLLEKTKKHSIAYLLTTLTHFFRNLIIIVLFLIFRDKTIL